MKALHMVAFLLTVAGAVNWGLVGFMDFNLVTVLFSTMPGFEKFVYMLIGASGVFIAVTHMQDCKYCAKK